MIEEQNDFKIGDVVMLNSGGPDMTVASYEGETLYRCSWTSENGDFSAVFDGKCLQRVIPSKEQP